MVETITPVVHGGSRSRWGVSVAVHAIGAAASAAVAGALLAAAGGLLGAPWGVGGPGARRGGGRALRRARARGAGAGAAAAASGARLVANVLPAARRGVPVRDRARARVPDVPEPRHGRRRVGRGVRERTAAGGGGGARAVRSCPRVGARARVRRAFAERRRGPGRTPRALGVAGALAGRERGRADGGARGDGGRDQNDRGPVRARRARGRGAGADVRRGRGDEARAGSRVEADAREVPTPGPAPRGSWPSGSRSSSSRSWGSSLVGLGSTAGLVSLVALALFSAAIVIGRVRAGRRLERGCFGGSTTRDYRVLLARNLALAGVAFVAWASGQDASLVRSLGEPAGVDLVPAGPRRRRARARRLGGVGRVRRRRPEVGALRGRALGICAMVAVDAGRARAARAGASHRPGRSGRHGREARPGAGGVRSRGRADLAVGHLLVVDRALDLGSRHVHRAARHEGRRGRRLHRRRAVGRPSARRAALYRLRQDGREIELTALRTDKDGSKAATLTVPLREVSIGPNRTSYSWSVLSSFTGGNCARTCLDAVPDEGMVEQPLPGVTPFTDPVADPVVDSAPRGLCQGRRSRARLYDRSRGDVAQLVEHLLCKQGVGGSSPLVSTLEPRPLLLRRRSAAGTLSFGP